MKSIVVSFFLALLFVPSFGQTVEVEFNKNKDYTHYKTFSFGQSQITTPSDQKLIKDATMDAWIVSAITQELEHKGLKKSDSVPELIVTYLEGTLARSDTERLGPLALTPGAEPDRSFTHEYRQSTLVIDLNDRSGNLIWRINSTTNMTATEIERTVDAIVEKGFKKFARPTKKKKKQ
jgi:Domain of unknown function (DUF4136)